jgi:hypothetical protein
MKKIGCVVAIPLLVSLFSVASEACFGQQTGAEGGTAKPGASEAGTSQSANPGTESRKSDDPLTIINFGTLEEIERHLETSLADSKSIVDHRPYERFADVKRAVSAKTYRRVLKHLRTQQQ